MTLAGTSIVITGAASGIGKAFAEGFLDEGASVIAADVNETGLADLRARGAITTVTDVSSDAAVRSMVDTAMAETGRVDVLLNNAGYGSRTHIEHLVDGEFEHLVAVHLFGCIYGMRAVIPIMRQQGHGRIVNVISRAAEGNAAGNSAYGAAKAAMWTASRVAAAEVADTDILVNMLFPGMTNTAIWGRDMPGMQAPSEVYPTARMLATLPAGGPTGTVFYRERPYEMFGDNAEELARDRDEIRRRAKEQQQQ